jgi:hypothetical protein
MTLADTFRKGLSALFANLGEKPMQDKEQN